MKAKNKGKGKLEPKSNIKKESKCFLCKKKERMNKDCLKHQEWLAKKCNFNSFVCFESNLTNVCHNTWWIDSLFNNPCFKYLVGYEKPKEAGGK